MKKIIIPTALIILLGSSMAFAANYVEPANFRQWLASGKKVVIVDVQPATDFAQHHFRGALQTNAFPGKSDEERKRLDPAVAQIARCREDVVIVCPRGGGGAKNAYAYLKEKGIDEKRLFILEKGMSGWPYQEFVEK